MLTNRGSIVKEKKTFHKGNNNLFQDMHDGKQIMTDKLLLISHFVKIGNRKIQANKFHDNFGNTALEEISLNYQHRLY